MITTWPALAILEESRFSRRTEEEKSLWLDHKRIDAFVEGIEQTPPRFENRVKIRSIGHQLNGEGGKPLMRQVAERATVLSDRRVILRLIDLHWNMIGDWLS